MLPPQIAALAVVHPVAQVGWTNWTIHWSTVVGLAVLGTLYLWGARRVRTKAVETGHDVPALGVGRRVAFFSGLLVIFASLNGPLHDLSDYYLFSAHMVQHLLLSLAVPPLLLVGTPGWLLRPLVEHRIVGSIARAMLPMMRCSTRGRSSQPGVPTSNSGGTARLSKRCCTMWALNR